MIDIALILTMTANFFIISWRNEPRTQIIRRKHFVFLKYTPLPVRMANHNSPDFDFLQKLLYNIYRIKSSLLK